MLVQAHACVKAATETCDDFVKSRISAKIDIILTPILEVCIDACRDNLCVNGGQCVATTGDNYNCVCPPGMTGEYCEYRKYTDTRAP